MNNNQKAFKQVFIGLLTKDDIVFNNGKTQINNIGGGPLYSAAGACIWGANSVILSSIGTSYDYELLRKIANKHSINIDNVSKISSHGIDLWILYDEDNEHYFIPKYNSDSYYDIFINPSMVPNSLLNKNNIFHISPMPIENQIDIIKYLKDNNCIVTLDPHYESCQMNHNDLWEKVLPIIDVFFPSELELSKLLGEKTIIGNIPKIKQFCNYYNLNILCLKAGKKGVFLYCKNDDHVFHIPSVVDSVINCTGAGDAFAGGFNYEYIRNKNTLDAVRYGIVSASFAVKSCNVSNLLSTNKKMAYSMLEQVKTYVLE